MSQFFVSVGQSIGDSALETILLMSIQDLLDLFAVQRTLKSLLQPNSLKASILLLSAFFRVQLSHPYMTTGKKQSFDQTDLCRQSQSLSLLIISNPSAPLTVRQWFQLEVILPLRGQLTMFGDTFSCHNWRRLLLASSKQMSGMLTIPQCTRQPLQQKIMFLKLRISALWSSLDNWPIPQSLLEHVNLNSLALSSF